MDVVGYQWQRQIYFATPHCWLVSAQQWLDRSRWQSGFCITKLSYPEVRQRVQESLAAVNLDLLIRRPIYALSGGQKQRVAIAGTIAQRSDVLLFDEPTALLDPDAQLDLVAQVRDLVKDRHLAALWVTHRLEELDYCDGAFLLENGQLVDRGDPSRLRQRLESNSN
jgi:energy-coupling factor transport system ATP-binding protein